MSGRVMNFVGGRLSGGGSGGDFTVTSIDIVTPPDKVEYLTTEVFDPTGMVVTVYFSDGVSEELTGYAYKTDGLTLDDDGGITISFIWHGQTFTTVQPITVTEPANCYTVEWDGTATTKWSRGDLAKDFTDPVPYVAGATEYSSPFDNIMPWSGMVRVTDEVAGEMIAIPKFWFKWTKKGNGLRLQIANEPLIGFYVSPAHMDRGDGYGERDVVYVSRYFADTYHKSTSSGSRAYENCYSMRAHISERNVTTPSEYFSYDYAMHVTIQMLYLVEFADWNIRAVIGKNEFGWGVQSGKTDDMPYHTGTTASSRTTAGFLQYRHLDNLGNATATLITGVYADPNYIRFNLKPGAGEYGGKTIGLPFNSFTQVAGEPTAFDISDTAGLEWAIYPTAKGGSDTTYATEAWFHYCNTNKTVVVQKGVSGVLFTFEPTEENSDVNSRIVRYPVPTTT